MITCRTLNPTNPIPKLIKLSVLISFKDKVNIKRNPIRNTFTKIKSFQILNLSHKYPESKENGIIEILLIKNSKDIKDFPLFSSSYRPTITKEPKEEAAI